MKTKCLMYCTKAKPLMEKSDDTCYEIGMSSRYIIGNDRLEIVKPLNGKIVCECDIETEELTQLGCGEPMLFTTKTLDSLEVCKRSCLKTEELSDYLYNQDKDSKGYALHISNINVFDKPLSIEKDYIYKNYFDNSLLTKAPQNMCNVYDRFGNKYILISVQPQHLVNILNGKKTIEVRRKVLKGMVE